MSIGKKMDNAVLPKKDRAGLGQKTQPVFQPNSQYPEEKFGDRSCLGGHVSAMNRLVPNLVMAHFFVVF